MLQSLIHDHVSTQYKHLYLYMYNLKGRHPVCGWLGGVVWSGILGIEMEVECALFDMCKQQVDFLHIYIMSIASS